MTKPAYNKISDYIQQYEPFHANREIDQYYLYVLLTKDKCPTLSREEIDILIDNYQYTANTLDYFKESIAMTAIKNHSKLDKVQLESIIQKSNLSTTNIHGENALFTAIFESQNPSFSLSEDTWLHLVKNSDLHVKNNRGFCALAYTLLFDFKLPQPALDYLIEHTPRDEKCIELCKNTSNKNITYAQKSKIIAQRGIVENVMSFIHKRKKFGFFKTRKNPSP